jgi:hypothetical protein
LPKASKITASDSMVIDGYEGHFENFDGGYTVGFETYTADADLSPLFAGLPDDRCQCAHWGYVAKGKVPFKTAAGRHRGHRVQPDAGAPADPRGGREEHGRQRLKAHESHRIVPRRRTAKPWRRGCPKIPAQWKGTKFYCTCPAGGHGYCMIVGGNSVEQLTSLLPSEFQKGSTKILPLESFEL